MQNIKDVVARYTGYTRFIRPAWDWLVRWVANHPKTSAGLLVGLAVVAAL